MAHAVRVYCSSDWKVLLEWEAVKPGFGVLQTPTVSLRRGTVFLSSSELVMRAFLTAQPPPSTATSWRPSASCSCLGPKQLPPSAAPGPHWRSCASHGRAIRRAGVLVRLTLSWVIITVVRYQSPLSPTSPSYILCSPFLMVPGWHQGFFHLVSYKLAFFFD